MQEKVLSKVLPITLVNQMKILIFAGLSILSFTIPFAFGHPQWLVGTVVNACLFLGAYFLPTKYYAPLIIFPSLGVLGRGIIFGPFTSFLIYFLPFIWLGNLILVLLFKDCTKRAGFLISVVVASFAKYFFLAKIAEIYFNFSLVPKIFLTSMGAIQLTTALAGGVIAFVIFSTYRKARRSSY